MKVSDYSCSRCGRKNTLERKGTELFQCSFCGAPYVIKGVATETQTKTQAKKLEEARKRLETLKNKNIGKAPQRASTSLLEKMRDLESLAAWAHIPMPIHSERDPEKMFAKYDLSGTRIVEKATGKTMFDFSKAREASKSMLWGIDEKKYVWS